MNIYELIGELLVIFGAFWFLFHDLVPSQQKKPSPKEPQEEAHTQEQPQEEPRTTQEPPPPPHPPRGSPQAPVLAFRDLLVQCDGEQKLHNALQKLTTVTARNMRDAETLLESLLTDLFAQLPLRNRKETFDDYIARISAAHAVLAREIEKINTDIINLLITARVTIERAPGKLAGEDEARVAQIVKKTTKRINDLLALF